MSNGQSGFPADPERRPREPLTRANLSLPTARLTLKPRPIVTADAQPEAPRPRPSHGGASIVGYQAVKAELHQRFLGEFEERNLMMASEEVVAAAVREFVERVLAFEDLALNDDERKRLADDLIEETLGVGPLAPLMADPAVTDILVNRLRPGLYRAVRPALADRRPLPRRRAPGADHPADRRAGRPARSTRRRRWSMPACPTAAASTRRSRR